MIFDFGLHIPGILLVLIPVGVAVWSYARFKDFDRGPRVLIALATAFLACAFCSALVIFVGLGFLLFIGADP
jgi:hypothetical protein